MFLTFLRSAEFVHELDFHVCGAAHESRHILRFERAAACPQKFVYLYNALFKAALHVIV